MNTRILRMCHKTGLRDDNTRVVADLGQVQPVLFCIERSGVSLRIEDAEERHGKMRPCWAVLPLPRHRQYAKALFSHLERCKERGTRSVAAKALEG
jgi:hypothetical protein